MGMLGIVGKKLAERKSDRLQRAVDDPTLDTDRLLYHWTEAEDIQQLKPSTRGKLGPGIYALPEPKSGQRYVDLDSGTANVLPLYARGPIAKAADTDKAREQAIINLGGRDANVGGRAWGAETNRVLQEQGFTGREVGGAQPEINVFDSKDLRSVHAQFKDPTSKNILAGSAATAVGVGAMSQSNRTLAGTHPGDNADMSGLTLIPEMVSTVINDVYKYGKQAVTGKQDDGRLMETPESEGDAVKIKDAISKVADWILNYKNEGLLMPEGGASLMDGVSAGVSAYQDTVRPMLKDALGEDGTLRFEATGILAATLFPGKNAGKIASTFGDLPSIRTREEVEAAASPDYGPVVQTRAAGESVDVPALEMQTAKGYAENPNVPLLLEGGYGDSVPRSQVSKNRKKYENNPLFREMQDRRADGGRFTTTEDLFSQSARYEDLVDKPLINIPADPTAVGVVDRLGGVDIEPMNLDGGPLFTDRYGSWMSMEPAARAKQGHALRVADETGQLPVGLYHNMKHEGSNFSTMPSEAILRYIDAQGGLDIEGMRYFDNLMASKPNTGDLKGIAADWPGWESTDQVRDWLMRNDPLDKSSPGNRRKAFVPSMMGVKMQDYGILPPNDLYAPINEQVMRNVQAGSVGMRGGQFTDIKPSDMQTLEGLHPSYNTIIPFSNTISLDQPMVPWNVLFKDAADARVGKPAHNAARSFQTSGADYQMFREEDLNRVNQYIESLPKLK